MPFETITVRSFSGGLLSLDLLADDPTILLTGLGSPETGVLGDNDGTLSVDDDGVSLFDGDAVTYVGRGTFQPGVNVGGIIVPVGAPVPVVIFNAGGQTYFHFPDGDPGLTGAVVATLAVDDSPAEVFENPYSGTPGNDRYIGDAFDNKMIGADGDDRIEGGAGDDLIGGGRGDDRLAGGTGADMIKGGSGSDTVDYTASTSGVRLDLKAGTGEGGEAEGDTLLSIENVLGSNWADTILASNDDNMVLGGGGNDVIRTFAGQDEIRAGGGDDRVSGGWDQDVLYGQGGNDALKGNDGNDLLYGGGGNDALRGGRDDDVLYGGVGDDGLMGQTGRDTLEGGAGDDLVAGGKDADTFVFRLDSDRDQILDFSAGLDRILLDEALWGGGLSVEEVIDTYGREYDNRVVLNFGDGDRLVVRDQTDLAAIADDIAFL